MTGRAQTPEISVIVSIRNGAPAVPALLEALERQTLPRERFEVIVVDNGSSDGTGRVAASKGAHVVRHPVADRPRGWARNRGAAEATGRLYAFTDGDCVPDPRWLEAFEACASRAPLVAGDVRLVVDDPPNVIERFELLWRFGQEAWVKMQGWAATANLLVHADAFEALGGFDDTWLHGGEDVDFCFRARAAGFHLDFCPEAVVEHPAESEVRPLLRRAMMHGYGVNQAFYRLGAGYRAWRTPMVAVHGDQALRRFGHSPDQFDAAEWRRMARLARLDYAGRIAGSLWAELVRAR